MITEVTPEAHKILKRWTRCQYYVYIRPLSSLFMDDTKHRLYWVVSVEYRTVNWQQWRGEGKDLSEIICKLDLDIPRRNTKGLDYKPQRWNGAYSPEKIRKAERKKARKLIGGYEPKPSKSSKGKPPSSSIKKSKKAKSGR